MCVVFAKLASINAAPPASIRFFDFKFCKPIWIALASTKIGCVSTQMDRLHRAAAARVYSIASWELFRSCSSTGTAPAFAYAMRIESSCFVYSAITNAARAGFCKSEFPDSMAITCDAVSARTALSIPTFYFGTKCYINNMTCCTLGADKL